MKTITDRSLLNVIPFGDATVTELAKSADLMGVSLEEAYDAAQAPIRANLEEVRQNPGIKGVTEAYWTPLITGLTGIDPEKTFALAGQVPVDELSRLSSLAAKTMNLADLRNNLRRVMGRIKTIWENLTPEQWTEEQFERWWKDAKNRPLRAKYFPGMEKEEAKQLVLSGRRKRVSATFPRYERTGYLQSAYWADVKKLVDWLEAPDRKTPPFTIFTEGSSKLPFYQWSTVPGATCPGAGACWTGTPKPRKDGTAPETSPRGYCYSLSGWRNVVPFLRQLQNTVLMRLESKSGIIVKALTEIQRGENIINRYDYSPRKTRGAAFDFEGQVRYRPKLMPSPKKNAQAVVRLYVDGDMDSLETLEFWMHVCGRFARSPDGGPGMSFYGYSKSWDIFLKYDQKHGGVWPENYVLNLSNGTFYERLDVPKGDPGNPYYQMLEKMGRLACTRGRFIALKDVPRRNDSGNIVYQVDKNGRPKLDEDGRPMPEISTMPAMSEAASKNEIDPRDPTWAGHAEWAQHMRDLRAHAKDLGLTDVFPCPGKCWACLSREGVGAQSELRKAGKYGRHACGEQGNMRGKNIVIAVH